MQLVALLQVVLYAAAAFGRDPHPGLQYFDPRLLVHGIYGYLVSGSQPFPSLASWLSAVGVFCLGEGVVQSRAGLAVYAVVESVFAAMFVAFAMLLIASGLSPSHGFSARELPFPVLAFVIGSAGPLLVALPMWRAPDYGD